MDLGLNNFLDQQFDEASISSSESNMYMSSINAESTVSKQQKANLGLRGKGGIGGVNVLASLSFPEEVDEDFDEIEVESYGKQEIESQLDEFSVSNLSQNDLPNLSSFKKTGADLYSSSEEEEDDDEDDLESETIGIKLRPSQIRDLPMIGDNNMLKNLKDVPVTDIEEAFDDTTTEGEEDYQDIDEDDLQDIQEELSSTKITSRRENLQKIKIANQIKLLSNEDWKKMKRDSKSKFLSEVRAIDNMFEKNQTQKISEFIKKSKFIQDDLVHTLNTNGLACEMNVSDVSLLSVEKIDKAFI